MDPQLQTILRDTVADIIFGTVFLLAGLAACAIAAIRRRSGVRVLISGSNELLPQLAREGAIQSLSSHLL
jgi:hypothetical protein